MQSMLQGLPVWMGEYGPALTIASWVVSAVAVVFGLASLLAAKRAGDIYRRLMFGPNAEDLHQILTGQAAAIRGLQQEVAKLQTENRQLQENVVGHLQHFGILRYNAFVEAGSDLSFSVAVLDGRKDGVVLTSLYGRQESRVYAKPLKNGISNYSLTGEEKMAIEAALSPVGP